MVITMEVTYLVNCDCSSYKWTRAPKKGKFIKCRDCGKKLYDTQVSIYKEPPKRLKIKITYDTGNSFHRESNVIRYLKLEFNDLDKAKLALKYIKDHYNFYMICEKELDASKKQKEEALKKAKKSPWYSTDGYPDFTIRLENDDGELVNENVFWTGYFESLVGADIEDGDMSFKLR